jgi:hypothetical protein
MSDHPFRNLITYAAERGRTVNLPHLGADIAADPELVKEWLYDLGRLVALDAFQHLANETWSHLLGSPGDDRLDGDLSPHLSALHTVIGTAIDIRDQRAEILNRFINHGDLHGLLAPAGNRTPPYRDEAAVDDGGDDRRSPHPDPAAAEAWPPYGLTPAGADTLIRVAAAACDRAWRGDTDPLQSVLRESSDGNRLCRLGADTWRTIVAADRHTGGPTP